MKPDTIQQFLGLIILSVICTVFATWNGLMGLLLLLFGCFPIAVMTEPGEPFYARGTVLPSRRLLASCLAARTRLHGRPQHEPERDADRSHNRRHRRHRHLRCLDRCARPTSTRRGPGRTRTYARPEPQR
jgi:hypothetical protein